MLPAGWQSAKPGRAKPIKAEKQKSCSQCIPQHGSHALRHIVVGVKTA
jgi:hypothetical protein